MIHRFHTIPSTMIEAARLAAEGAPHGTAVVADAQTAGIGRHGHSWHSEPASGLYVSIVLRLSLAPEWQPLVTLALGLATVEAIAEASSITCDLRWPNDAMIGEKKTAGIMAQLSGDAAIAGIGINVNHTSFPEDIAPLATSLALASGRAQDRENLLSCLLTSTQNICELLERGERTAILRMFTEASSYAQGKRVRVDLGNRGIEGVTAGLDDHGFLLVRKTDGTMETVIAGSVRPA